MSENKLLKNKLKQALRYKTVSFNLIKGDDKTTLNRSDIHYLLSLLTNKSSRQLTTFDRDGY